ncbi:MAG: glycosyltransferase family protein [Acidimicrobiales bacterium]
MTSLQEHESAHADTDLDATSPMRTARIRIPGRIAQLVKYFAGLVKRHRHATMFALAFVAYLSIALWVTGMPGHSLTTTMVNESGDPNVMLFFLKWWPWAILHGHNPFVVSGLTHPAAYNAAWLTSIAAPALLAAPITLVWGPVATWNLLILAAPVAASMSMLALLDSLEVSALPAAVGGFIFGFCSFEVAEMSGHLFLILIFPIPLLVMLCLRRFREEIRPAAFVVFSVLLASFMLYTSTELSLTTVLSALGAAMLFAFWYPQVLLGKLRALARELALIVGGVFVLTAPLLWYLLANLQVGGTAINSPFIYSTDVLNFVIPTPVTWFGSSLTTSISTRFTGNFSEEGGYLGIVLVILTALGIAEGIRRGRWAVPFAIWTLVLGVCTLGPVLHADGNITAVRLPWDLPTHLPILKDILPSRLMVFCALGVAMWVALWVSWGVTRWGRAFRLLAVLLGAAMLLPNPAAYYYSRPDVPRGVSDGQVAAYVHPGSGVLVLPRGTALPFSDGRLGVLWSEASGFRFDTTAPPWGYNPYPKSLGYLRWPLYTISSATAPPPGTAYQIEVFCAAHNDSVVAIPTQAPAWAAYLRRLGWAHKTFTGLTVFRVPRSVLRQYRAISVDTADVAFLRLQVVALQSGAACYLAHGGQLSLLTPDAAIADHCLAAGYTGVSTASNWTVENGWLGPQGQGVGIGIASTGSVAHQVFARLQGTSAQEATEFLLYDPNPHPITLPVMAHDPQGTYLMVVPQAALLGRRSGR